LVESYVPDQGQIVWLSLDPTLGREQSGRRPFLALSPRAYNAKTSLSVGVPITTRRKGYPFEVALATGSSIRGVALVDQIKSLDWRARSATFAEDISPTTLRTVRRLLATFLAIA
jgi:mRNA interferase MazF